MIQQFGAFSIGTIPVALPLESLREVVPIKGIQHLPTDQKNLLGAIDIRGMMVPVINLGIYLPQTMCGQSYENVIVVLSHGRVVGIAAHSVIGIREIDRSKISQLETTNEETPHILGAFADSATGNMVTILNPDAMTKMPGVPSVSNSEYQVELNKLNIDARPSIDADSNGHWMIFRCNGLNLAIDTSVVHTTLLQFRLKRSSLSNSHYIGSVDFDDLSIPAVDLSSLCGLSHNKALKSEICQAFVIKYGDGYIAYLIDEIIDVIRIGNIEIAALPPFTINEQHFFTGTIQQQALLGDSRKSIKDKIYILNHETIQRHEDLTSLSKICSINEKAACKNINIDENSADVDATKKVLLIDIGFETSVFVEDVIEILPWTGELEFDQENGLCSILAEDSFSIPVYPLSNYFQNVEDMANEKYKQDSCVLISECGSFRIGFIVHKLMDINTVSVIKQQSTSHNRLKKQNETNDDLLITARVHHSQKSKVISVIDINRLALRLCRMENLPALEHLEDASSRGISKTAT